SYEQLHQSLLLSRQNLTAATDALTVQRKKCHELRQDMARLQEILKRHEIEYCAQEAVQQAALLKNHEHDPFKQLLRLGHTLNVAPGWELAVETVLQTYFDAICVDEITPWFSRLSEWSSGKLTIVARQQGVSNISAPDRLIHYVTSDWPLQQW